MLERDEKEKKPKNKCIHILLTMCVHLQNNQEQIIRQKDRKNTKKTYKQRSGYIFDLVAIVQSLM